MDQQRVVIDDAYVTKKLCLLLEQVAHLEQVAAQLRAENAELRSRLPAEPSDDAPAAEAIPA